MPTAQAVKPIHIGVTIYRDPKLPKNLAVLGFLNELGKKLKHAGYPVSCTKARCGKSCVILEEVFQDPKQRGTLKRLDVNGVREPGHKLDTPGLPDTTEINLVTQYAKGFLEAKGLLVKETY